MALMALVKSSSFEVSSNTSLLKPLEVKGASECN